MPHESRLGDATWPEIDTQVGAVLVVPLGSTEQHGPHLPLSTDTDVAVALAELLAARHSEVRVAPALAYGSSGEHDGFAGTLSIGREAVELVVLELGRSASNSFDQLVFVSAHGGNCEPVTSAVRRLQAESRHVLLFEPRWRDDPHAGHVETSIQLALGPQRVRVDRIAPGNTRPMAQLWPELRTGGVRAVSANGILGDPTHATAEDGIALLERLGADLDAAYEAWRKVTTS